MLPAAPTPDRRVATSLDHLPTGRRSILVALKRRGDASADELAADLGVTVSAVRQHLAALAEAGLVTHERVRTGPGRPRHAHRLTPAAGELFPRAYAELTTELLACVEDEDPEMLERVFERRRRRRVERTLARMEGQDLAGRVRTLTAVLDEDGYVAEATDLGDGAFRVVEHNCAILNVALRYGAACGTEISFIREVLPEAEVERTQHLLDGSHVCGYSIVAR
ncbi:MAG TPA: ArsR family transcriptional regulator [Aquihabitans sp.]|jgi:predicted ArsR family transcriptional regulator|nr:ArsR family transcriptional regulator [Aquihabitans sp.]